MPSREDRNRSPPGLLASKADGGILAVRRGGRTRKAPPGERIGRRSRHSWIVLTRSLLFSSPRAPRYAKPAGSRLLHRARLPCLSPPRSARSCLPTLSSGPDHPSFGCETRSAEIGPPTPLSGQRRLCRLGLHAPPCRPRLRIDRST